MPPDSPRKRRRRPEYTPRFGSTALKFAPRLLLAVLALLALGVGGVRLDAWARRTPQFALRSVQLVGAQRATEAELLALGGVQPGTNLWALDTADVARAMAGHPWVSAVDVHRALPDTLQIRVEEHVPAALAVVGDLYVVDAEGVPFKKVSGADALDLPLITGVSREEAAQAPEETQARFRAALALVASWGRAVGHPALSEVHLEESGMRAIDVDGQVVALAAGAPDDALARLVRVRSELHRRGLTAAAIHLENRVRPSWVAVQLAGPEAQDRAAK
jgi:cell division protein FtsQ